MSEASRGRVWRSGVRAGLTCLALAVAGVGIGACGSSGGTSSKPAGGGTTAQSGSSSAAQYVATAKKIEQEAEQGVVYSASNDFTGPDGLVPATRWLGPTQAPAVPTGKSIAFVSCGAGACNEAVQAGAAIARQAGFRASLVNINGAGDVQNLRTSMDSALALHPSAIVTMAIAATQVGPQLDEARKQGVVTVSAADPTLPGGPGRYDAAADYPNGLSTELLGWSIVADSGGKANVVAIRDESFPAVIRKIGNLVKVVQGCSGCTVKTVTWQVTDAVDSAKAANILTGVVNGNPNMDTLVLPYSLGMPSAVQAVAASGRRIRIYADDADAVNLQTLRAGHETMISAVDPKLVMYQAVDQVIRGLDRAPFIEPARLPYLAKVYTPDTVPARGPGAFQQYVDYASNYTRMWGGK